jgi:hypothetical protein
MIKTLFFRITTCSLFLLSELCLGESYGPVKLITPAPKSEVWIDPGLYSYHYDREKDLNSTNYGFGIEYKYSSVASLTAGSFKNSNYRQSNYIGAYWQPISIGPVNLGVVAGGFNGYSNRNNGGWFPAILPALTIEKDWVGLNLMIIPTIPNHVSGSLSLQIKFKVFE